MAKITASTLLLVALIDCSFDKTAYCDEFHSVGFTTREIRRCRCSTISPGRIKCPYPLIPTDYKEKQVKLSGLDENGLLKVIKCRQPQTGKYTREEKQTLKHCLCCRVKGNQRLRSTAMNAFCGFSCFPSTPL